jgi:pimeloyl-ACP methyl ester carboxylesterase
MSEQAVMLGHQNALVGIVSTPATPRPGRRRAVLTSNVGLHYRAGPFRLFVELARTMEAAGWWALRFDQSAMGDSAPRTDTSDVVESAARDLGEAMDYLRDAHGIDEFIVVALCSGVDSAHLAARDDPRIVGAVFIDGYTYPTTPYWIRQYVHRLFELGRWKRYVVRRVRRWMSPANLKNPSETVFDRTYPPADVFARDIRAMQRRGVQLHFVYTGTVSKSFNSEAQLLEMLGAGASAEGITVAKLDGADHVFMNVSERAALMTRLERWAARAIG